MAGDQATQAQAEADHAELQEPLVVPDVATQPHPAGEPPPVPAAESPDKRLQDVLPDVTELAQKVGGYKKLSKIAETLGGAAE